MNKTLLSLLFLGLSTISAVAGPLELNKALTKDVKEQEFDHSGEKRSIAYTNMITKTGCEVYVQAKNDSIPGRENHRDLTFTISDDNTRVDISDSNSNGLDKGDYFSLEHRLGNGQTLYLVIDYLGGKDYHVSGVMGVPGKSPQGIDIDTSELNPLLRLIVNTKIKPVTIFGQRVYEGLVESVSEGKEPELPYEDVKKALNEIEPYLIATNIPSRNLESGLLKLSDKYIQIAKQRSESLIGGTKN